MTKDVPPYAVVAGNPAGDQEASALPPELISPMLRLRWWRFAPWQLTHLDITHPHRFVAGLLEMEGKAEPFEPSVIDLSQIPP